MLKSSPFICSTLPFQMHTPVYLWGSDTFSLIFSRALFFSFISKIRNTNYLHNQSWAQTEWNCLSRRWDIVKVSPPEQTTRNAARQSNTHCFQEELPALLLTQLCLGFHSKLNSQNNDPRSKLRGLKKKKVCNDTLEKYFVLFVAYVHLYVQKWTPTG